MKKRTYMVIAAVVFTGCCCASAADVAFRLGDVVAVAYDARFDKGKKDWSNWGWSGANDLATALSRVTGKTVPLVPEAAAPKSGLVVWVGDTAKGRAAGFSPADLRRAEWRIVTRKDATYVLGNTGMGASYGCTDFLRRYADYWFLTFGGYDPYTVAPEREVPVADVRGSHAIYSRHYHCWGRLFPATCRDFGYDYTRRVTARCSKELDPPCVPSRTCGDISHTYFGYCPPAKYAKEHPEYYSLGTDGKRHAIPNNGSELCLTNPEVFDIVYASMVSFIEKDREGKKPGEWPVIYDFSQMDNCGHLCLCDNCKKVIAKYNREPGGHDKGGDAGLQLEFVNRLARKVGEKYPDVIVRTFAYNSTEEPPKPGTIVPADNVMMWLCDLYGYSDHQLPLTHPFNANRLRLLREWSALSKHFEVWDYYLGGGLDVSVDAIAADVRLFRDMGLTRMYNETQYRNQPFYTLNLFVTAELYRDPDQDVDTLVGIWCRRYGAGAAKMRAAIDFFRKIVRENPPLSFMHWHARILPYKTAANFEHFAKLCREAHAAAEPGCRQGLVSAALAAADRALLTIYARTPGAAADYARVRADYLQHAPEGLKWAGLSPKEYARERDNLKEALEIAELRFDDLPPAFRGVPADDIHCLDARSGKVMKGKVALGEKVADPLSPVNRTMRWTPHVAVKPPYLARLIDEELYSCVTWDLAPPPEGRYEWQRVGMGRIHRNSWLGFAQDNAISFRMPHLYIECDGLPVDPNWYEFWVSCRREGDTLFYDRLALRRVKPPKGGADGKKSRASDDD